MKQAFLGLIGFLLTVNAIPCFAQGSGNHGGDPCEEQFQHISNDIRMFLKSGRVYQLQLKNGLTPALMKDKVLEYLDPYLNHSPAAAVAMECSSDKIYVDGEEKTCAWSAPGENSKIKDGKIHISCNFNRFMYGSSDPADQSLAKEPLATFQYKQTLHEWLGIAGIEKNQDSNSTYSVVDQISASGGYVEVYLAGINSQQTASELHKFSYDSAVLNSDLSATLDGIVFTHDHTVFQIDASDDPVQTYQAICRIYNYDGYFAASVKTVPTYTPVVKVRYGKEPWSIQVYPPSYGHKSTALSSITCYRKRRLMTSIEFKLKEKNPDGSVTLSDIWYHQGQEHYQIGVFEDPSKTYQAICKTLGFENAVDQPGNASQSTYQSVIQLDAQGHGVAVAPSSDTASALYSVTCRSKTDVLSQMQKTDQGSYLFFGRAF